MLSVHERDDIAGGCFYSGGLPGLARLERVLDNLVNTHPRGDGARVIG